MKAKNIIYIISLMFAAMSCSMDSDTMMDDTTKGIENSLNGEVAVSFSLTDGSETTKSVYTGTDNTTDQTINNVTVFLLKGENVIDVKQPTVGSYANCFYVKKGEGAGLSLIVVANSSISTSLATANEIGSASINLGDCTKYGKAALTVAADGSYSAAVVLSQSYAKVELTEFNVTREGSNNKVVSLDKVEVLNINTNGQVNGTAQVLIAPQEPAMKNVVPNLEDNAKNIVGEPLIFNTFAYSYKNESADKQMVMRLTYSIDNVPSVRDIIIQGSPENQLAVEAGCIYQIVVNANLKDDRLDFDVVFKILNWIDGGTLIDGDLVEIK